MNMEEFNLSFSAMQWAVLTEAGIYIWFTNRQTGNSQELMDIRTRIAIVEEHVRHLPDLGAVIDLEGDIKAMRAQLTGSKDALASLARSLERINGYLLRKNHDPLP